MKNRNRSHDRAYREQLHLGIFLIVVGLMLGAIGGFFWDFELTPGLNHTEHACHVTSYLAVCGSFGGICALLFGLWTALDAE